MTKSNIQWTDRTWNPTIGCSKVSAGCQNCYAIKDQHRLSNNPNQKIRNNAQGLTEKKGDRLEWTGQVKFLPERLEQPLRWRKPSMVFVNSQSDLFHEAITDEQLDQIFAEMAFTPQHLYQVLTKRPERMAKYVAGLDLRRLIRAIGAMIPSGQCSIKLPLPNVWLGVTCENQKAADERIPWLLQTPAAIRFLSCEPLLEKIDLEKAFAVIDVNGEPSGPICDPDGSDKIGWVIAGGESGHSARPCDIDWIQSIVDQCNDFDVPCFVKQLGSRPLIRCREPGETGFSEFGPIVRTTGKGGNPEEWPEHLRVRQFPKAAVSMTSQGGN